MFGKLILKPFELVKNIEKSLEFGEDIDFMMIVLKNSEKLEFYKSIDFNAPFPFEHFKID